MLAIDVVPHAAAANRGCQWTLHCTDPMHAEIKFAMWLPVVMSADLTMCPVQPADKTENNPKCTQHK